MATHASPGTSVRTWLAWASATLAVTFTLVAAMYGPDALGHSNPPNLSPAAVLGWALASVGMGLALVGVFSSRTRGIRVAATIAFGLGWLGAWFGLTGYIGNYHDYPWMVVAPLVALSTLGAWCVGLRFVPLGVVTFLIVWLGPALMPARRRLPVTVRNDGLECTLLSACRFRLRTQDGRELSKAIDVDQIEVHRAAGELIEFVGFFAPDFTDESQIDEQSGPEMTMWCMTKLPKWVRTCDIDVTVHRPGGPTRFAFSNVMLASPALRATSF